MVAKRFDVYLINLDPTIGSQIKKTRPCLVISPKEGDITGSELGKPIGNGCGYQ